MPIINSTCDISTIFNGGGPPDVGATVVVGTKQLIPAPFVNINLEKYKSGDKTIGGVLKVTLNGTAVGSSFNGVIDGEGAGTGLKDILELGQLKGCVCVVIKCSSGLINGYGKIISVSTNEGNQPTWVNIAPYSIEIELYSNSVLTDDRIVIPDDVDDEEDDFNLKQLSEQISWNINDDTYNWGAPCSYPEGIDGFGNRHIKVNFNINVAGIGSSNNNSECICNEEAEATPPTGTYGLEAAEKYLRKRLKDLADLGSGSLFDMNSYDDPPTQEIIPAFAQYVGGNSYMDFRTIEINPPENSINISGEIIYRPSGCLNPDVFTSLNVDHQLTTDEETITINGNINGLVDNNFDEIIQLSSVGFDDLGCEFNRKMEFAENFLSQINDPGILNEIASCYTGQEPYPNGYIEDDCPYSSSNEVCTPTTATPPPPELCSMRIISSQIGRNLSSGEITFSFVLSNAPNCEVAGATKLDVSITHDKPHDNIVEIIIPGRGSKGALIQNLCCVSPEKYDITIDAILNRKNCSANIKQETVSRLRDCAEKELEKLIVEEGVDINCWFKVNDVETIANSTYKLSRSYVKPSCP